MTRWRQENFFKYLREEYALDALVEYATEPDDPAREVPNPKWKMVAYQVESELFRLVTPHDKRAADEGRTLVQSALASAADIEVSETELRVLVAPQSSLHRTHVLATLCGELNATPTTFPGTNLILRYDVAAVRKR